MDERKTIFDYIGMVFSVFGFFVAVMSIFCILFGEEARAISSMFSMGNEGISIAMIMQYFAVSALIIAARVLFCTDMVIRNMAIALRTVCMVVSAVVIIVFFVVRFGWFPVDMWAPWVMFFVSFGICFVVSMIVTVQKEKADNRKMEEALAKLKQKKFKQEESN